MRMTMKRATAETVAGSTDFRASNLAIVGHLRKIATDVVPMKHVRAKDINETIDSGKGILCSVRVNT
jgi:hypothetical protein